VHYITLVFPINSQELCNFTSFYYEEKPFEIAQNTYYVQDLNKGKICIFMNKQAKENIVYVIFAIIVILLFGSAFLIALQNISCSTEKAEIERLSKDRDFWKNQTESLNESVANCSNLIQEQINNCDRRIQNATKKCEDKNSKYEEFIIVNRFVFLIYNVVLIVFYIPLTLHLFKITFKIGLGKKWEELMNNFQRSLLIVKIIFWIILTLVLIAVFINFLIYNPIK
jgi:hypothetical protein